MHAAKPHTQRGITLLLEHCARLNEVERPADQAAGDVRLRQAIGEELARLLLTALSGDHRARLRVI
jgi:hypothetical protein